jgi:predicted RNase H-like HicB family nuclease
MTYGFVIVIERDAEGDYVASVPSLPGCHTQARSPDELDKRIKEAIVLYLEDYIWRYGKRLMTDLEQRTDQVGFVRAKTGPGREDQESEMLERLGVTVGPDIELALSAGWKAFRRSVCRRILSERGDEIINRCPRCHRVVRTPEARQCFWCGHDWHGAAT